MKNPHRPQHPVDLAFECKDLAGEIHKVYQRLNLSGRNAAVDRLRRKVSQLAELAEKNPPDRPGPRTSRDLEEALSIVHECVPLLDLNLKKLLLSPELQERWNRRLERIENRLKERLSAT